jgi:heme/copper-type cytochrome/quinol oxidase subunit 4
MTDMLHARAPGDRSALTAPNAATSAGVFIYTVGLLLAVILTATSFWATNTTLLWAPGIPLGLAVLAVAQMGVHLVFFLHITTTGQHQQRARASVWPAHRDRGRLRVTLDHDKSERQHDAAVGDDDAYGYAYAPVKGASAVSG